MQEKTTAVVIENGSGIGVYEDATGWEYEEVGAGTTIVSLIRAGTEDIHIEFPLQNVNTVALFEGEEAVSLINEAEKGNL